MKMATPFPLAFSKDGAAEAKAAKAAEASELKNLFSVKVHFFFFLFFLRTLKVKRNKISFVHQNLKWKVPKSEKF